MGLAVVYRTEMPLSVGSKSSASDTGPLAFLTVWLVFGTHNYKDLEYSFVQEGKLKAVFRSFITYQPD